MHFLSVIGYDWLLALLHAAVAGTGEGRLQTGQFTRSQQGQSQSQPVVPQTHFQCRTFSPKSPVSLDRGRKQESLTSLLHHVAVALTWKNHLLWRTDQNWVDMNFSWVPDGEWVCYVWLPPSGYSMYLGSEVVEAETSGCIKSHLFSTCRVVVVKSLNLD